MVQLQASEPHDEPGPTVSRKTRMMIDALAGAISGCISRIVVGPLDVIKIRFQASPTAGTDMGLA